MESKAKMKNIALHNSNLGQKSGSSSVLQHEIFAQAKSTAVQQENQLHEQEASRSERRSGVSSGNLLINLKMF